MCSTCGCGKPDVQYEGTKVGKITHYFDKISVAVIEPEDTIKKGDNIKIYDTEGNVVVEQAIDSMQIDNKDIESAEKGQSFGMKVSTLVKEGYLVYKQ